MKLSSICLPLFLTAVHAVGAVERPNIIFILADDLGASDLGAYGSSFYQTPNIDRLAREGMQFTQAYSACTVCSPSRASLLTGRNPAELHITNWIPGQDLPFARLKTPDWTKELNPVEPTLADYFKEAGYTTATIGKWHLGQKSPTDYGFDLNIGGTHAGHPMSYFSPYRNPALPNGPPGEYLNDRLTQEAAKWIEANKDRPFFLYLPHFAVHTPVQGKPDVVAKYQSLARPSEPQHNPNYAALVESVDDSVGRIRAKLEELGIADKTIIVFTSDNGGTLLSTVNLGLRGGKGMAYEGGVRVPLIYYWPGQIKSGRSDQAAVTGDHLYTLLDLAGVENAPASSEYQSLKPTLLDGAPSQPRDLFWHYPHYDKRSKNPYSAIRSGDYKLIEFFDPPRQELYDLRNDPEEKQNLATKDPATLKALQQKLSAWRDRVHAQMLENNPNYDPVRAPEPAASKEKSRGESG